MLIVSFPWHSRMKILFLLLLSSVLVISSFSQNAIVTENANPGVPASQWDISNNGDGTYGDKSIQGFATDISVNKGQTINFKITITTGTDFKYGIKIYRVGYYQGNGARLIADLGTGFTGVTQNACSFNGTTGLTDCGNWTVSGSWAVPATAVSGIYLAKLTRSAAGGGGSSHITFIVRDDASTSAICFKTSDATWQAYNSYGGYSLYVGAGMPFNHGDKVSYNRPFLTRDGGGGGGSAEDYFMNAEYPMIRFLERNGFDLSYVTDVDAARSGSLLLNHKIFLSVGHDEYWSKEERNSVEAMRSAGKHLAFFSGNESYWKTRWENSVDGTNTPFRTMVCYKEGTLPTPGENPCGGKCDPSTEWTGLWRDGCSFPSGNACKPENGLTGEISWDGNTGTMQVPSTYKNLRFWRNTSIASLGTGLTATLTAGTLGYEWDWEQYASSYPPGRITMSSTSFDGHVHKLSFYKATTGSLVFGAGTVQWSWGLDAVHDRGNATADPSMQQATINLFADMGAQPATLQSGLVAATASTDNTAPTATVVSPANGSTIPSVLPMTISGTASDGATVAVVEISFDGGATWTQANGTTNWTYSWTPPGNGSYSIKVRGVDDSGNYPAWASATTTTFTVNATVIANAGSNQTISLPTSTVTLNGSGSTGTITSYQWTQVSGPNTASITTPAAVTTTVTGLIQGSYVFRLSLNGGVSTAQVTVTVNPNPTPVANAGSNQTITLPTSTVTLNGSGSTGTITSYLWTQVSGPNTASITTPTAGATTVTGLIQGSYVFRLSLNGGVSTSQVTITVNPAPVANAGANQTIILPTSTITLNGSGSTGTITSYLWTQVSGPNTASITTPASVSTTVTGLIQGSYVFRLSLNGGVSTAQVTVTVNPAPLANAGVNQTIILPTSTVTLNGGGSTGTITSYLWTQVSGPNTASIATPAAVSTTVTGLIQGSYVFGLSLNGGVSTAQVTITVNPAPVANAGANQTIILPTSTVTLNGSGSTGTITSYLWTQVSGPNTASITTPAAGATTVTGLIQGSYVFALSLNGGVSTAQVTITVNPAPGANAGINQTIILPTSTVTLDGSGSTGTITSYLWTLVSGPNTASITTPAAVSTTVTGLIQGSYVFGLSLNGGTSIAQVTVTVKPAPVANAGTNQTIILPTSTVTLDGSGSTGTITSYLWTQVSGPNTASITTPAAVSTTVTGLLQGSYVFGLSLNGGVSIAQVTVTVNPAPVANAGTNQTIILPTSTVSLNGSGSTGTITSYLWTQVSGPNTASIATPAAVSTTVTSLIQGSYVFGLSLNGGTSIAQVMVTVNPAPGANAGSNQTIILPTSTVTLNGSGSTGTITSYLWTQVSGPNIASISTPTAVSTSVTGLIQGSYVFGLSLNGGTSTTQVTVTVKPAPVANAGSNQTIVLPTSTVTLDASGSTGTITSYQWTQASGPNTASISTPTTVSTSVTGLIKGSYVFRLSLNGGISTAQVTVTVNPDPTPVANAGVNQTITLPTSALTLDGSGSTGTITSYLWTQVSGPNTASITTPTAVNTTVKGLIEGSYVFALSLNEGISTAQVTVIVNPDPTPVANAGGDQTIALPTSTVTLDGSGSTGTITSYLWTQVSGPKSASITTPAAVTSTVTGLIQGSYVFELSLNGGVSTAQVTVTVSADPTPVANAGSIQTITLPTSTVTLDGRESTGTITSYLWMQISGPNIASVTTPAAVSTTVTGLIQGSYIFRLSLNGGSSTAQVMVIVKPDTSVRATPYYLGQNYPNPSTQGTKINFGIPSRSFVEIVLFDMQGRLIKVLVNELKESGNHVYELNTGNLAKGIYYYTMSSGNYVATKKLMVQ